jgi:hypothetical protein
VNLSNLKIGQTEIIALHFMNESEIDHAKERHKMHPILGPATELLSDLRDLVNQNSDGWCYWRAPVKAADKLMTMIESSETPTKEAFKKALAPIRAFCTRHKLAMPEIKP